VNTLDRKPSLIGCCWSDDLNPNPQHLKVLERNAVVVLSSTLPIELKREDGEPDENIAENLTKRLISDRRYSNINSNNPWKYLHKTHDRKRIAFVFRTQ
jgi:hypothetical protein